MVKALNEFPNNREERIAELAAFHELRHREQVREMVSASLQSSAGA